MHEAMALGPPREIVVEVKTRDGETVEQEITVREGEHDTIDHWIDRARLEADIAPSEFASGSIKGVL